jgi:hypothetical protein
MSDDRTPTRDNVQVNPGGLERHHDVGVKNGGVNPVATHRLKGDLGHQLRTHAALEHADALSARPILRQRTSRLSHEPHRQAIVRVHLAACGYQKRHISSQSGHS